VLPVQKRNNRSQLAGCPAPEAFYNSSGEDCFPAPDRRLRKASESSCQSNQKSPDYGAFAFHYKGYRHPPAEILKAFSPAQVKTASPKLYF